MLARTSLVLFASVTLALGLAGCGDDEPKRSGSGASKTPSASSSASPSGSSSGSAAPVDPSASAAPGAPGDPGVTGEGGTATGADKQVCDDQEKLVAESTRKFGEAMVQASQGGGGDQAGVNAVKALFTEWAAGMRAQAAKAVSPELKQALTQYAQGLDQVNAQLKGPQDLEKMGDLNTTEIEQATDKVLRICG